MKSRQEMDKDTSIPVLGIGAIRSRLKAGIAYERSARKWDDPVINPAAGGGLYRLINLNAEKKSSPGRT